MKNQLSKTATARGFTLIELLVVIAIIAILAAILFPVFAQVREKARQTSCESNLKQLGLAIVQYNQDYDETYPIGFCEWSGVSPTWPVEISPYVKTFKVYQCPDDSLSDNNSSNDWEGTPISYVANGASVWSNGAFHFVGIFDSEVTENNGAWGAPIKGPDTGIAADMNPRSLAGVVRPSDTIMLAEMHNSDGLLSNSPGPNFSSWQIDTLTNYFGGEAIPDADSSKAYPEGPNGAITAPHSGKKMSNFLFVDGHVKALFPTATDPDEYNQPDNDMWDATRQ